MLSIDISGVSDSEKQRVLLELTGPELMDAMFLSEGGYEAVCGAGQQVYREAWQEGWLPSRQWVV